MRRIDGISGSVNWDWWRNERCGTVDHGGAGGGGERLFTLFGIFGRAALLMSDGDVIGGANFENASYGLTLCAETVATATASAAGGGVR